MATGFIGLGNMGARMALRLLEAGHPLVVHDVNPESADVLKQAGAEIAESPLVVASRAETVFCSLPTPGIVQNVILGKNGLVHGSAIKLVIDLSTTGPRVAALIHAALGQGGIDFIDAPVSGGTSGAAAGTLTIMLSGKEAAAAAAEPFLKIFGNKLHYLGERPGLAQSMKLANNMLCAAVTVASFESLIMGVKAGLDPKVMLDVINSSSGRNFATMVRIPECILDRSFPVRFSTELLHKDVKLGLEEAENLGVPMWVIPMARQYLAFALTQGDGALDYAHTIKHLEAWAGVQFGTEKTCDTRSNPQQQKNNPG